MAFWSISDEKLMTRVQKTGDESAFAQLVNRWRHRLEQASFRILNDRHKSEDLVQEAFTRLYLKRAQYRHGARLSSYLWRITLNLCQDELRRRTASLKYICTVEDPDQATEVISDRRGPDSEAQRHEEAAAVRSALEKLPDQIRIIVVMRHYQDLKFREIAEILEVPEGTVKTRMMQGLALLAKELKRAERTVAAQEQPLTKPTPSPLSYETSHQ